MWSYYGAKTNIVDWYPKPKYDRIIEPFAGSARYALNSVGSGLNLTVNKNVFAYIEKVLKERKERRRIKYETQKKYLEKKQSQQNAIHSYTSPVELLLLKYPDSLKKSQSQIPNNVKAFQSQLAEANI